MKTTTEQHNYARQLSRQLTAAELREHLHPSLHSRIVVDASRNYSRKDGDTRDSSDLPVVIVRDGKGVGEAYNWPQIEIGRASCRERV